ncbi:MAG: LysM domain-containing protein [Minicystis sp.]
MFDANSRYAKVAEATIVVTDEAGEPRTLRYKRRRFIPQDGGALVLLEHTVRDGDRLDNVTARYLGDPTQFWRVCDANGAIRPDELVEVAGRRIKIAMPLP